MNRACAAVTLVRLISSRGVIAAGGFFRGRERGRYFAQGASYVGKMTSLAGKLALAANP